MPSCRREGLGHHCVLNEGTKEQLYCYGYHKSLWKYVVFYILPVVSFPLSIIRIPLKPNWADRWRDSARSIKHADFLLLLNISDKYYIVETNVKKLNQHLPQEFQHFKWSPRPFTMTKTMQQTTEDVDESTRLLIQSTIETRDCIKYFIHQKVKYGWVEESNRYCKLSGYDLNTACAAFLEKFKGFSDDERLRRLELFGKNEIRVEVKSHWKLLFEEVIYRSYIFIILSIVLLLISRNYISALSLFVYFFISIWLSLYNTRQYIGQLHNEVPETSSNLVTVRRKNNEKREIRSSDLVPGDVIIIPLEGCVMSCDAVLISGQCEANESSLTGRSFLVAKTPILNQAKEEHTLFCGTEVSVTSDVEEVSAVVIRTGFSTSKGELIRTTLYSKSADIPFYADSKNFLIFVTVIAALGMTYAAIILLLKTSRAWFVVKAMRIKSIVVPPTHKVIKLLLKAAGGWFIVKLLFGIKSIVVPPSLPVALALASVFAQRRLRAKHIFCTSPSRTNVAGKLRLLCFDKTGTLTEICLDMYCVIGTENGSFQQEIKISSLDTKSSFLAAMATCHSLMMIDDDLTGDPLDINIFKKTGWKLTPPNDAAAPTVVRPRDVEYLTSAETPYEIEIIRRFPFSSTLQMMSVIAQTRGEDHMDLYAKGAPEKIISICLDSTIPDNFKELLFSYTVQGFRVIAVAHKKLDRSLTPHRSQRLQRNALEKDLTFLGLIIMHNALKRETAPVIDTLHSANIRTVMATGDNMHTAIRVARKCRIIGENEKIVIIKATPAPDDNPANVNCEELTFNAGNTDELEDTSPVLGNSVRPVHHLATDGESFAMIFKSTPKLLIKLARHGTVFARMTPEQKTQLVQLFQDQGYVVGMCGDGDNDCGAIKAAHVGISLSTGVPSVMAPFTSKVANIGCVLDVIKDGRCTLVTSISIFKFMASYSIIQFVSQLILYTSNTRFSANQFFVINLVIAASVTVSMGCAASSDQFPSAIHGKLCCPSVIICLLLQIFIAVVLQVVAIRNLYDQSWFHCASLNTYDDEHKPSFETTVIFCLTLFQCLVLSMTLTKWMPFRKPGLTDVPLVLSVFVFYVISLILVISPYEWMEKVLGIMHEDKWEDFNFRLSLLLYALAQLLASFLIEYFVETPTFKTITHFIIRKKHATKASLQSYSK